MLSKSGIWLLIVAALALWGMYMLVPAYTENARTKRDLKAVERNIMVQQQTQEDLRDEIHKLKTDARAVERVARDKFGLCRPDEKVYDFGATDEQQVAPAAKP